MNASAKFLTKKIELILKLSATALPAIVLLGATAFAQQSINDDLKPKTTAKVKASTKTPSKTQKKTASTRRVKKTNYTRNAATVGTTKFNSANTETPDQIINRFMNFQQSAGVTDRDWKSVVAQTTKTLKTNPNHSVAKAQSFIAQGQLAYNKRNFAEAINQFKAALQILPASSLPHYSLGRAYLANGQAEAAERSFKEAISQNENFALAYKGLGDSFNARGEKKTAVKYFRKATEISVKDGNMAP